MLSSEKLHLSTIIFAIRLLPSSVLPFFCFVGSVGNLAVACLPVRLLLDRFAVRVGIRSTGSVFVQMFGRLFD